MGTHFPNCVRSPKPTFSLFIFTLESRTDRHGVVVRPHEAQVGDDPRGAGGQGAAGVQHRTALRPHRVRQGKHAGPDQLQEQQEAAGAGEGLRPPLQHGPRGCQGDVDRAPQDRKGQEEVEASEQGPIHPEDVPQGRLGHPRPQEPARLGGRQRTRHSVEQERKRERVLSGKKYKSIAAVSFPGKMSECLMLRMLENSYKNQRVVKGTWMTVFWLSLAELGIYRSVNQHRNSLKIVKSVLSATLKFSL